LTANLDRLRLWMADRRVPALLLSSGASVNWASGFTGSLGFLFVTQERALLVTDSRYTLQAADQAEGFEIAAFSNPVPFDEFLARQAERLGLEWLGFESHEVSVSSHRRWREAMPSVELVPLEDPLAELRMVKSSDEVAKIRAACGLADACFDHMLRMVQPGVCEYDIGLEIEFFIRRQGAELAFVPVVVSGARSARPHGRASEKLLEVGDFLTLDFGARLDGYCSDITRTVVVGRADERHREIYDAVLQAQMASVSAMRPGAQAKDIDAAAREVLATKDLARYFGHGTGHGLGREVHDAGRMNPSSSVVLEPGQVWTVEPGVYIEGFGGVRIEDDVVVNQTGVEVLTKSTKEFLVLPR
jgi:Xaa-Pro aminopeptidase